MTCDKHGHAFPCADCYRALAADRTDQVRELANELAKATGRKTDFRFARDQRGRLRLLHEHPPVRERG